MENLLDNPMKAVLYLKELTTIVQNQQSLIQTQRQRIDELEQKVEELIGENHQLKEPLKPPQYHHQHQHASPPSSNPQPPVLLHRHPANKAGTATGHGQPTQQQTPSQLTGTQHPPPPAHQQQLQPLQTSVEDFKKSPCCRSLVSQVPSALCRTVGPAGKAENQTVLHQFCCPAPDAPEAEPPSSTRDSHPPSCAAGAKHGGLVQETQEEKRQEPGAKGRRGSHRVMGPKASLHHITSPRRGHSHAADYQLSLDLKTKQIEMLEHKYGGHLISRRAACRIQTAFRQYQLSKNFEKIRNSLLESRLPRRISMRKVRVQNSEGFSAEKAMVEGYNLVGMPLVRSPSLPTTISGTLTDLEDSFTEQVQSLAKSIDDALSNWSQKTVCSMQDGGRYQFTETFSQSSSGVGGGDPEGDSASPHEGTQEDNVGSVSRSTSKLMMAFRDVTVQIDNQNFHVSSSVMESTSVSLPNCVQQQGAEKTKISPEGDQDVSMVHKDGEVLDLLSHSEFPAPPPCEEESLALEKLEDLKLEEKAVTELEMATEAGPETLEVKRSESDVADNSSEQMSSSSTSTSAKSTSDVSSKETLQAMILSLPRLHCENPAVCKSPTLSTDVMRKRLYRIGLNLFNLNPDRGVQFLVARGFIPDTPIGVAHFLLQRKGLSRQMIGEFLGNSKKQFNKDILDCVVDEMDFSGMELDEALRKFQAHIRVQGEAQKVERLIEAFSQRYCMCNSDVVQKFHNPDTIFILAFAIILLNTDMYSPSVKADRKMLLEDFIRNLRAGVDDGVDIPRDMVAGIYERIQQRELRSNEDHVTYVTKVEQSILGMKTVLSVPHRRLVCCSRIFEVMDINKAQKQAAHQREVFLFNDLIVILKLSPKKRSSATYTFCRALGLLGMQYHLFENEYHHHGITIVSPCPGSEKKQVLNFCGQSAEELQKFVEDLKESIAEVHEMEQIQTEWELESQHEARSHSAKNGTQLEIQAQQASPLGKRYLEGRNGSSSEVSIHNRLQTCQFNTSRSPESGSYLGALRNHQGELCCPQLQSGAATPVHRSTVNNLPPETLIQCQQIVKVIVLDQAGRGHPEAFLSRTPSPLLVRSAYSTPARSPEVGNRTTPSKNASQPPLPPPPPPYNHPHQYCPPEPQLNQRRYSGGYSSLM
ncbi:IQ motif and SEC7 domain-containing protein 3-like isoform X1 [Brienomyrus brachyistius]|uniref:IQ motif and SEC7 domain-containing protein 3-like isoform X1 n=1 Tax=Brienomyrus brachyistius TaxID=42636 RepID=UPI0020B17FF3|nr:IQ motif and SEC7 domain-containing protein 3-like isoform X1 [Brienomyrus brachyistius]